MKMYSGLKNIYFNIRESIFLNPFQFISINSIFVYWIGFSINTFIMPSCFGKVLDEKKNLIINS